MQHVPRRPLTLIIPVHGRQEVLNRALGSLDRQCSWPEEVIVVDDGSPLPTAVDADTARRLNIRLIRHETNRGAAAARNTGLRAARTEWVTFLDSDDFLLGGSLSERWRLVQDRLSGGASETTIFGCGWVEFAGSGGALRLRWPRPGSSPLEFASGCWFSPGSCVILNRSKALDAAGFQDESLWRFEDVDWFLSLALHGFSLEVLPVAGVAIERHRAQRPDRVEHAANAIRTKWRPLVDTSVFTRLDSYLDLEVAAAYRFCGSRLLALKALAASMRKVPRLSLQLSPGWDLEPMAEIPHQCLPRPHFMPRQSA